MRMPHGHPITFLPLVRECCAAPFSASTGIGALAQIIPRGPGRVPATGATFKVSQEETADAQAQ